MAVGNTIINMLGRTGILFGALFLVSVLLAAIPSHRAPSTGAGDPQNASAQQQTMPEMDMSDEKASEAHAVHDMAEGNANARNLHLRMTAMRPKTPEDIQHANEVAVELRSGIEKYKDYHVALNDGYKIFMPNLPQPEYHFTNYRNGFLQAFTFEVSRPTSLLYKKTAGDYELVGAMYMMPKRASEDQLNARVPLSVAMWHLHTNLCLPPKDQLRSADWTKFGLKGSIATEEACTTAGGRFQPSIFGWMVHVYPYEDSLDKIFAMHHHMD